MGNDEAPEPGFADKRQAALVIHRAPTPRPFDDSLSYFGGLPRLPPSLDWPTVPRREEDGPGEGAINPTFIAQIDIASLPNWKGKVLFPSKGTIYIFCNTQFVEVGDPYCKVIYSPASSKDFPERRPPSQLMRIGGTYDPGRIIFPWLDDDNPLCGIDHKFAIQFEPLSTTLPGLNSNSSADEVWRQQLDLPSKFPLLMKDWPQTPLFASTFRAALIAETSRCKKKPDGTGWVGYDHTIELIESIPKLQGDIFRWLDDSERASFRELIRTLIPMLDSESEHALHYGGVYSVRQFIDRTAFWCAAQAFAEGAFDSKTSSGYLFEAMKRAAQGSLDWPNQILGAPSTRGWRASAQKNKSLLLQVCDNLACLDGDGTLQFWVPSKDLMAGVFDDVEANFDC